MAAWFGRGAPSASRGSQFPQMTRHPGLVRHLSPSGKDGPIAVIPAKAGIQGNAGYRRHRANAVRKGQNLPPSLRTWPWIPAFAGMTGLAACFLAQAGSASVPSLPSRLQCRIAPAWLARSGSPPRPLFEAVGKIGSRPRKNAARCGAFPGNEGKWQPREPALCATFATFGASPWRRCRKGAAP